jgi:general secretion pathway protein K
MDETNSKVANRKRGSALVLVLWIIGLLSMMIASLAFDAHIEARITSYYRKRNKATYLARSGLEIARLILEKRATVTGNEPTAEQLKDRWYEPAQRLKNGAIRGLAEKLGEGSVTLDIEPEPARRNINNLDLQNNANEREVELNMERILEVGGITEYTGLWPKLIESMQDWTDANNEVRQDGAETEDYYATLKPPYKAANGPLDTVEELLLVKGFNRTILSGGSIKPEFEGGEAVPVSGIGPLLTTYGDGKVNVNSASLQVLQTLPDVDEEVAGAIVEERQGYINSQGRRDETPFKSVDDLAQRIPEVNRPGTRKYITTADSQTVRITSVGEVSGVKRKVWCIGEFTGGKIKILRWREDE